MITDGSSVFKSIGHDSPRYVWDSMLKYIQLYTDFMQFMLTVYHSMTYESYLPELSRMETPHLAKLLSHTKNRTPDHVRA